MPLHIVSWVVSILTRAEPLHNPLSVEETELYDKFEDMQEREESKVYDARYIVGRRYTAFRNFKGFSTAHIAKGVERDDRHTFMSNVNPSKDLFVRLTVEDHAITSRIDRTLLRTLATTDNRSALVKRPTHSGSLSECSRSDSPSVSYAVATIVEKHAGLSISRINSMTSTNETPTPYPLYLIPSVSALSRQFSSHSSNMATGMLKPVYSESTGLQPDLCVTALRVDNTPEQEGTPSERDKLQLAQTGISRDDPRLVTYHRPSALELMVFLASLDNDSGSTVVVVLSNSQYNGFVRRMHFGKDVCLFGNLNWAWDDRWIAVATGKRMVPVFATQPYIGLLDGRSHVKGRNLFHHENAADVRSASGLTFEPSLYFPSVGLGIEGTSISFTSPPPFNRVSAPLSAPANVSQ
ncbi:hypothetical protein EI94DRAFT_1917439 [Lactarius quietus]|nr:hypothetical protein EI94DRAFT_1917439 [Lactarius quietus]